MASVDRWLIYTSTALFEWRSQRVNIQAVGCSSPRRYCRYFGTSVYMRWKCHGHVIIMWWYLNVCHDPPASISRNEIRLFHTSHRLSGTGSQEGKLEVTHWLVSILAIGAQILSQRNPLVSKNILNLSRTAGRMSAIGAGIKWNYSWFIRICVVFWDTYAMEGDLTSELFVRQRNARPQALSPKIPE